MKKKGSSSERDNIIKDIKKVKVKMKLYLVTKPIIDIKVTF
jgi:hypothetical protein